MSEETVKTNVFMGHRSYRTLPGPLQHLNSFLLKPFCCRFVDVLVITVLLQDQTSTKLSLSDRWPHDWLWSTLVYREGHWQVLWLQKRPKWSPLQLALADVLCLVLSNVWLCVIAKDVFFGLICSRGYVRFLQMQLCKLKLCCHVLFLTNVFSLF